MMIKRIGNSYGFKIVMTLKQIKKKKINHIVGDLYVVR